MIKLFKTFSEKENKKNQVLVDKILALDESMKKLTDEELKAKTNEFKERLKNGETLDDLLVEAFAVVRETSDRTLKLKHYPVQLLGAIALHNGQIAEQKTGEGKACTNNTKIPTPDGWKTVGDIKVGDYLFGKDGNLTKVLGVYPQKNKKQVYEVELIDGRVIECCEDHLWSVYTYAEKEDYKTFNTKYLYEKQNDIKRGYKFQLPVNESVYYSKKDLPVDPYLYGVILGDGCKGKFLCISTSDKEILENISKILNAYPVKYKGDNCNYYFKNKKTGKRITYDDIRGELELGNLYAHEKYIDDVYKISSKEQRLELIKGIMDTDGCIDRHLDNNGYGRYNLTFSTVSSQLRDDFIEVIRSLGYNASWSLGKSKSKENEVKRDQYVVNINVNHSDKKDFFKIKRHLDNAYKAEKQGDRRKDYSKVSIKEIRKTNRYENMTCFEVDNEEHLFLIGDYVVTHNTLTETAAVYLNALEGKGVHVVTVNDYLAKRDKEQMEKIYGFLGMTTGFIQQDMTQSERKESYNKDITYGTNNQFGFDYLRDNMVLTLEDKCQRGLHYAIVDEVDSILIDEARTPLIISGAGDKATDDYSIANNFVNTLKGRIKDPNEDADIDPFDRNYKMEEVDYVVDEKKKTVILTEKGTAKAEKFYNIENLADVDNTELFHYIQNALKANNIMKRDIDYLIKDGQVEIVDEFTGRVLKGRRYSDGLHQAIEAKEGVEIKAESKTLASVTFQNLFRMYDKLSGMTGTAKTEEKEFNEIYKLDVVTIPTNKPVIRKDLVDEVYITEQGKFRAITRQVKAIHETGQPILIGTTSIENSEKLSEYLKKAEIPHKVLNAKNNEKEAEIIAQAGRLNSVTIATNMAGRGTDIMLGGNLDFMAKQELKREGVSEELISEADSFYDTKDQDILEVRKKYRHYKSIHRNEIEEEAKKVRDAGGLYVMGSERHESRRIDNQLRGRSGRQGDPGVSKFFISIQDPLIRMNGGEQLDKFMSNTNINEDDVIISKFISRSIEKAQTRVEANNFATRKQVLDYDNVLNTQRTITYQERDRVLHGEDLTDNILEMVKESIDYIIKSNTNNTIDIKTWDMEGLMEDLSYINFDMDELAIAFANTKDLDKDDGKIQERVFNSIYNLFMDKYLIKKEEDSIELERFGRVVVLKVTDETWVNHIDQMDQLRREIGVQAMGQKDPKQMYTVEAFEMYEHMTDAIRLEISRLIIAHVFDS